MKFHRGSIQANKQLKRLAAKERKLLINTTNTESGLSSLFVCLFVCLFVWEKEKTFRSGVTPGNMVYSQI